MIYVVRSSDGRYWRRGNLISNPLNASFGHSPSGVRTALENARAAMPSLTFEAVPLRNVKVMGGIPVVADPALPFGVNHLPGSASNERNEGEK